MKNESYIGIFGRRNSGKSSIFNALINQSMAIVSDIPGTTTDPIKKSIEILNIGPVIFIDTAGIDDEGEVGTLRVEKTYNIIKQVNFALLVTDHNHWCSYEMEIVNLLEKHNIPFIIIHNKNDQEKLSPDFEQFLKSIANTTIIDFSIKDNATENINKLTNLIAEKISKNKRNINFFEGLIDEGNLVMLVTPVDSETPQGRMILPQVQAWRHLMDMHCAMISCRENKVAETLQQLSCPPHLVVTDSQVFDVVNKQLPGHIRLTSFSILLARQNEYYQKMLEGAQLIGALKTGDKILILESCSHQVSCDDIGRVKLPEMLKNFCNADFHFDYISGLSSLPSTDEYALAIQCGGCMVTQKQLSNRLQPFVDKNIPITNYGLAIAFMTKIFERLEK